MRGMPRLVAWLLMIALGLALAVALLPVPVERGAVDITAPSSDSDYVTVHGLPRYFLLTDSTVQQRPTSLALGSHFLFDWFFFFCAVCAIVFSVMFIAFIARSAARAVLVVRR
jgi:hypothetical protein